MSTGLTPLIHMVQGQAIAFALSWVVAFVVGHRLRSGHWTLSLLYAGGVQAVAWFAVSRLHGAAPEPLWWVAVGAVTVFVVALSEDWNAIGQSCMASTATLSLVFLGYLVAVNVSAHLGGWSVVLATTLTLLQASALVLLVAGSYEILDVLCRIRWRRVADPAPSTDFLPRVSLHVPAYNEPPEMVIETLDALSRLDYPDFEVLLIDNNTRDEALWRPVEAHCAKLGFRFIHLDDWPGYKSGALNHGLTQTDPDAEIVGVIDADYVVEPDYLRRCVGFFREPWVAFVQTPQDYRDVTPHDLYQQACYDAYLYFFKLSMASRNEHNGIIFAGTMGLIRRRVLEEMGGWDEWCITEDAEISLRMLDRGYVGVYVDRSFGRGLMPLNFEGLKKQRFRWAFGGMQILRRHWRALMPWARWRDPAHHLTLAQQWDYLLGGLQWLNDPLTFAFTILLLIGAALSLFAQQFFLQPLAPAVLVVPFLFIFIGVSRFLWAFRVRLRCGFRRAVSAFMVLMALTWVVTLACVLGLVKKRGVFLRTPKKRTDTDRWHPLRIVTHEAALAGLCLVAAAGLLVSGRTSALQAGLMGGLLAWQSMIYLAAPICSAWGHASERRALHPEFLRSSQMTGERASGMVSARAAVWGIVGVVVAAVGVLVLAARLAPESELAYRARPVLDPLLPIEVRMVPPSQVIRSRVYFEKEAALRGDVDRAMRLWSPRGIVRDVNYTPDDTTDDRVWVGADQVRQRYVEEFARHRYLSLRHRNASVVIEGDRAVVVNDLEAKLRTPAGVQEVYLTKGDRWTFEKEGGRWWLVSLEVNRSPR